ncbi:hypothetical protein WG66_008067 [Moniliophthora roreri]|nr:hypothetical protein WG66_008067 [Moniliophthora roreri]
MADKPLSSTRVQVNLPSVDSLPSQSQVSSSTRAAVSRAIPNSRRAGSTLGEAGFGISKFNKNLVVEVSPHSWTRRSKAAHIPRAGNSECCERGELESTEEGYRLRYPVAIRQSGMVNNSILQKESTPWNEAMHVNGPMNMNEVI